MNRITRLATTVVLSGGLGLVGLGLGSVPAQAGPVFGPSYEGGNCPGGITCTHWCPGDPLIPGSQVITWDWNVCHDWYWNSEGIVDVGTNIIYPWHGVPHDAGLRLWLCRRIRLLRRSLYRRIAPRGRPSWPRRGAAASSNSMGTRGSVGWLKRNGTESRHR